MARIATSAPRLWIYSGQQWAFAGMTVVGFRPALNSNIAGRL
jgi:hypothetical protein